MPPAHLHSSEKSCRETVYVKPHAMTDTITLSVPRSEKDKRFDAALFSMLEKDFPGRFSRSGLGKMIRAGQALRNGKADKPSTPVSQDDILTLTETPEEQASGLSPYTGSAPKILEETPAYVAIDKPAGLQVHPVAEGRGETLAHWIASAYPETASVGEDRLRPGIMHRLDRETSGVMLIAKTQEAFLELKQAFHDRKTEKVYIALVFGHLTELSGTIDQPLGQRSGELRRRAGDRTMKNLREAVTEYRVIARYPSCDLVLAMPKTGRTHQIRAHFAWLGHPIIGDRLYASKQSRQNTALSANRHMLHAWRLSLPFFSQKLHFQAPLPTDFKDILRSIDPDTYFDEDSYQQIVGSR